MKKIKTYVTDIAAYINQFTMPQTVIAFAAGGATTYYLFGTLSGLINNRMAVYFISALTGTGVGLVTVYGVERDSQKVISRLLIEVNELKQRCHQLQVDYIKKKGQHHAIDGFQLPEQYLQKAFSLLEIITTCLSESKAVSEENVEIRLGRHLVSTTTQFTGRANSMSEDPDEMMLDARIQNKLTEENSASLGFFSKVWQYFRSSPLMAKAIMLSNFAMISYYLGSALQEAELDPTIVWVVSIVLGLATSPVITYLTAAPARKERIRLEQERHALESIHAHLTENYNRQKENLEELKELSISKEYKKLYETLKSSQQPVDLKALSDIFKKLNSGIKTNKESKRDTGESSRRSLSISSPIYPGICTPLLTINSGSGNSSIEKKQNSQQSAFTQCGIM
jgi:hypothetical protein